MKIKWGELFGAVIAYGILVPLGMLGILMLFGMLIEGITTQNMKHERCLKQATNGYEIEQCR